MTKPLPIAILFLVFTALLSGCFTTKPVVVQTYDYDKNINFTITSLQEAASISTGSNSYFSAKKGFKLIIVTVDVKNHSGQEQDLDFNKFCLLEPKSHIKYKVDLVMLQTLVSITGRLDIKIKKNDSKQRRLIFAYPKDETAEMFSVDDNVYNIKYADTGK